MASTHAPLPRVFVVFREYANDNPYVDAVFASQNDALDYINDVAAQLINEDEIVEGHSPEEDEHGNYQDWTVTLHVVEMDVRHPHATT